jgi:hypothetical protein
MFPDKTIQIPGSPVSVLSYFVLPLQLDYFFDSKGMFSGTLSVQQNKHSPFTTRSARILQKSLSPTNVDRSHAASQVSGMPKASRVCKTNAVKL